MFRKVKSNNLIFAQVLCFLALLLVLSIMVEPIFNIPNMYYPVLFLLVIFIAILCFLNNKNKENTYPADCWLNVYNKNIIEFHIGNECEGLDRIVFYFFFITVLRAIKEKKSILMFTYHIKEGALKNFFADSISITKATGLEKIVNLQSCKSAIKKHNKQYGTNLKFDKNKYIKCYLDTRSLSEEQINKIEKRVIRLEKKLTKSKNLKEKSMVEQYLSEKKNKKD